MEKSQKIVFELNQQQLRYKEILNKEFLQMEIWAISDIDPNRNKTHFSAESLFDVCDNGGCKNKPIVGFFNQDDFADHTGKAAYDRELQEAFWDTEGGERVLGVIRESDPVSVVEKDGLHWLKMNCVLFVQYCYRQIKRLLKDRTKKVSVEVTVLESEIREDGIEEIKKFLLNGITILGKKNGKQVMEAIPDAHCTILEQIDEEVLRKQKHALSFAYRAIELESLDKFNDIEYDGKEGNVQRDTVEETCEKEQYRVDKDEIGTGPSIEVDKSAKAMSDKDWGSVDKQELRERVVLAKNFKTVAKDIFLDLRDGWEDGEVSKMKYPVMEVENNRACYNRGAIAAAKAYAVKNGETAIMEKIEQISENLNLEQTQMSVGEEAKVADAETMTTVQAQEDGEQTYQEIPAETGSESAPTAAEPHVEHNDCGCGGEGEGHDGDDESPKEEEKEECKNCKHMQEEVESLSAELERVKAAYASLEEKTKKYEADISELEGKVSAYADYDEIKARMEKAEITVWEHFCEQLKHLAEEKLGCEEIANEDRDQILMKAGKGEYANEDELDKEIAYAVYKNRKPASHTKWEHFNVDIPATHGGEESKPMTRQERLASKGPKNQKH